MVKCIKSYIKNMNLIIGCTNNCRYCYARTTARRYFLTKNFSIPVLEEQKLRLIDTKTANNYLMTAMSDFSDWKDDWKEMIFSKIENNLQHNFIFLTKSPDKVSFSNHSENVWMGVTVTSDSEKERISLLKKNIKVKHYLVTFEPLFSPIKDIDFDGIEWIVIGTETGKRKGKVEARKEWVEGIVEQAQKNHIPIFMKEELSYIMGDDNMIQQLPKEFLDKVNV